MFNNTLFEAEHYMREYEAEARRLRILREARKAGAIESRSGGVRFPLPEWLKQAPFVLRSSTR